MSKSKLSYSNGCYGTIYVYSNIETTDRCIITLETDLSKLSINTDYLNYSRLVKNHYQKALARYFAHHVSKYKQVIQHYNNLMNYDKFLITSNAGSNYQDAIDKYMSEDGMILSKDGFGCIIANITL